MYRSWYVRVLLANCICTKVDQACMLFVNGDNMSRKKTSSSRWLKSSRRTKKAIHPSTSSSLEHCRRLCVACICSRDILSVYIVLRGTSATHPDT
jgi:hypothetical protein